MCDVVYKWLKNAMDYGISEITFWENTIAENIRAVESAKRVNKRREQERAAYDYVLADLIGKSIFRLYSSSAEYPNLSSVYPSLFDSEEEEEAAQETREKLSIARFVAFANAHNKSFAGGAKSE